MDASLKVNCACTREATLGCRWHDGEEAEAANRWHDGEEAEAANRWHDEAMANGCFYLRRIRDALRRLFPELRDEPKINTI